jgi:hypothetical protein
MTGGKIFDKARTALDHIKATAPKPLADQLGKLIDKIDKAGAAAQALKTQLEGILAEIDGIAANPANPGQETKYLTDLLTAVAKLPKPLENVQKTIINELEQPLLSGRLEEPALSGVAVFLLGGEPYLNATVGVLADAFAKLFDLLATAQRGLVDVRNKLWGQFSGGDENVSGSSGIGDDLANLTFKKLAALLLVPCPVHDPRPGTWCPAFPKPPDDDYLSAERKQLESLATALAAHPPNLDQQTIQIIGGLFAAWRDGHSSPQELARRLTEAANAVLAGDLKRIVDLEGARRRIEEKIRELVPAKILLNYDMQAELKEVSVFHPRPGSQITLSAGGVYDLLDPTTPPQLRAACNRCIRC